MLLTDVCIVGILISLHNIALRDIASFSQYRYRKNCNIDPSLDCKALDDVNNGYDVIVRV